MGRIRISLQFSSLLRRYFSFSLRFADTFRDSSSFFNNFPPRFIPVHRFRCTRQICCQSAIFLNPLTYMDAQKKRGIPPLLEFPDIQILYHSYLRPLDFSFSARSRSASSASIERIIAIL